MLAALLIMALVSPVTAPANEQTQMARALDVDECLEVTNAVAGPTDEPTDPGSGYLWSDNFDRYASLQAMEATGSCGVGTAGNGMTAAYTVYGQMTDYGVNTEAEACDIATTHPEAELITGRGGSGKAIRTNVTGSGSEETYVWRTPVNPRAITEYTGALAQQYYFRLSTDAPVGAVGYKWNMMWYNGDPGSSRIELSLIEGPVGIFCLNAGLAGNSSAFGEQYQGPYWDHGAGKLNDNGWHRQTCLYLPNTTYNYPSASSRDGYFKVWIDGTQIIDVSSAGVTAGRCTNDDLDRLPTYPIEAFTLVGTLNDPPDPFTIDIDDLKVWVVE